MSCKLYANIGVGHENDVAVLDRRIVAAAQCNADAIVLNKATPRLAVPEEKKYVSINSKWGNLPYIEVAKKSELSKHNVAHVVELCNKIGIPIIWSVTDIEALHFIRDIDQVSEVKMHIDCVEPVELIRFCADRKIYLHCSHKYMAEAKQYFSKNYYTLYYTTEQFPPEMDELKLSTIDTIKVGTVPVAYESREAGIFPAMAVAYKGISYIEKYLGDDDSDNPSILTPTQFYDLWNSLNIMNEANG